LLLSTPAWCAAPAVIWASDPVRPGETVVVRGDAFGSQARVEVLSGDRATWLPTEVFQQTDRTLKFLLPASARPGITSFRVVTGEGTSPAVVLNAPQSWWLQGDETDAATPGGWLRVFGLNLDLRGAAKLVLSQAGRPVVELTPQAIDAYNFKINLPSSLSPGAYEVSFVSGESAPEATVALGRFTIVAPAPAVPADKVLNVVTFGAVPAQPDSIQYYTGMKATDQVDSTAAIQKALDAAGAAGGGVVFMPRGVYVLSAGLKIPAHVTLRGAGRGQTVLSWIDEDLPREKQAVAKLVWGALLFKPIKDPGSKPHPFLIKGPGHFTIEDLALYAVNHTAGIQSDYPDTAATAGHVKIRRVVMRLDRFIHTRNYNNRHYTNGEEVFLKRLKEEPQRCVTWMGAIHLSGPNIEITDCDLYSSMSVLVLNGATGLIARNRFNAVPTQWSILGRKTHRLIFEHNECLNGGVSLLNVQNTATNEATNGGPSNFSRELYFARNSVKDVYSKDRDGGFVSDFHAPLGIYTGWAVSSDGARVTLGKPMVGKDLTRNWAGAIVTVVDGKGAGQFRFMKSLDGSLVEVDQPWQVPLDETSFVSISKTFYRSLFVENEVSDCGNAVSLWAGGVEMVVAGNRSNRGGSFNIITLCHDDQFMPTLRVQFVDNVIADGMGLGAGYLFPRGSLIGTFTYTPVSFQRVVEKNKGRPVAAPDYSGPLALDQVFRRNRIETSGAFYAGGVVGNILFENGFVAHSTIGVDIRATGGRWDDALFKVGPTDILIRGTTTQDVTTPYAGDYLKNAKVLP
jgi:hypothetical protein